MTILNLYALNGNCADFWVQHREWTNACALVRRVNGARFGPLLHIVSQQSVAVLMDYFDVRSGRPLDQPPAPVCDRSFTQIAEPAWSRRVTRT